MNSTDYLNDLHAARTVWGPSQILGGAGMFIFTTYATLPLLTSVGSTRQSGEALMLRKAIGVQREKEALVRLIGIDDNSDLVDGLANPRVRHMLTALGKHHRTLPGMTAEYLDLFAGVIAISPIRIRASLGLSLETELYQHYWRYMAHSLALLGADLGEREAASKSCARFIARHTETGPRTREYLAHLFAAYPEHMVACGQALFPETRQVLARTLAEKLPAAWFQ